MKPFRRLLPYLRRYRVRYALGAACVLLSVALRMSVPFLLGGSFDLLRELGAGPGAPAEDPDHLRRLILASAGAMVIAAALCALCRTASRLMILGNSRRAVHDLREDVFAHLEELSPQFYVRHRTGHVMSRCVNDMQNVQGLMGPVFMYLVETFVLYAVGLGFMLHASPLLTVVGLLPFPLFLWRARRLAGRIQVGSRVAQEQLSEVSAKVDESLSGQKVIKSLALERVDFERFAAHCTDYRATMLDVARARARLQPGMVFLTALSTFLVIAVGGPMVVGGSTSLGDLVSMVLYLQILAAPTGILGFVISSLQRGAAALARIVELIDMPDTLVDPPRPVRDPLRGGAISVVELTVRFRPFRAEPHLSGSLPAEAAEHEHTRRVLDAVSIDVPAGGTLGIVGPTGAGKTTLLRALCRQLDVERGRVFIDSVDIADIALRDLRRAVGVVPQETFLFSATLAENVAFGRPDAARVEIEAAVRTAQLETDLAWLPDGLDTMLGERGVNLSGGQRQRVALARVLLLEPRILLLDDALSAVDTDTADRILTAFRPIMAGRTTVIVAHRTATVRHADQIVVLDDGRVVERGTHGELLARDGPYAALWRRQGAGEHASD